MTIDENFEVAFDDEMAKEAEEMVDQSDLADFDPHEDDAELLHGIFDLQDNEELEENRVVSVNSRIRMGQRMKRMAKRYALLRKIKQKRMAPMERLQYRSRKAALLAIRRRIGGKSDRKFSELSPQQKLSIDRMVAVRYPGGRLKKALSILAKIYLPQIRKKEMARLEKVRTHDSNVTNVREMHVYGPGDTHKVKKNSKRFTSKELDWTAIGSKKNGVHDPLSRDDKETTGMITKQCDKEGEINNPYTMFNLGDKRRTDMKREMSEARKSAHGGADAGDEGDNHIIAQLQKAAISRGEHHHVTWLDGSKTQIHPQHAKMGLAKWHSIMRGSGPGHFTKDKMTLLKKLGSGENSFYDTIGLQERKMEPVEIKNSIKKLPQDSNRSDNPFNKQNQNFTRGPGPGAISPHNTFGEDISLLDQRRSMTNSRHVISNTPPPGVKTISPTPVPHRPGITTVGGTTQPTASTRFRGARKAAYTRGQNAHLSYRRNVAEETLPPEVHQRVKDLKHLASDALKRRRNVAADKGDEHTIAAINHLLKKKRIEENFAKKAEKYDIPMEIIEEVYERGLEEGDEQAAFNRVNSFITGGFAAELDEDLFEAIKTIKVRERDGGFHYAIIGRKPRKKSNKQTRRLRQIYRYPVNETGGAGELGTSELTNNYAAATPGQGTEVDMTPASFSAPKPWENDEIENRDDSRSPKTYQDIRKAIYGHRDLKEAKITPSLLQNNIIGADAVKRKKDGNYRIARGFYYSHGRTPESHAKHVSQQLNDSGIKHTVVDHGQERYPFKGGASTWKQSHYWVDVKLHIDKIEENIDSSGGFSYHPNQSIEDDDSGDLPSTHSGEEFSDEDMYMAHHKKRRWHHHRIDDV